MTAAAWAVPVLTLAGCAAWAARGRISAAVLRARWAWRCRGHSARPDDGEKLNRADYLTFVGLVETWRQPAAPERSRT